MKTLKFKHHLVPLILSGKKNVTWRLFDDKNLQVGDELVLINKDTGEEFGKATIISTREKRFADLDELDYEGHERFENEKQVFAEHRSYYGDQVSPESIVKIVKFKLLG